MEWIGRTATLAVALLLITGCRSEEPEPVKLGPISLPEEEAVARDDGPPTVDEPIVPEETPSDPQPAAEPVEEIEMPIEEIPNREDTIGAAIEEGAVGAVAKSLWRSFLGETAPPPVEESAMKEPPVEEAPVEETPVEEAPPSEP